MPEYTDRRLEPKIIKEIKGKTIMFTDSWCFGGTPEEVLPRLEVGGSYLQETRNFSTVTGMATFHYDETEQFVIDEWLWRKSDEDLDREHAEFVADFKRRNEEALERNREDWTRREAALPSPLRRRLERFRANGGHQFEVDGWGYELTVCELAVIYAASKQEDTDEIWAYANEHGTSGNQHDFAKALSRHLTDDPEDEDVVANSVSALSPLTGDPDYSKGK